VSEGKARTVDVRKFVQNTEANSFAPGLVLFSFILLSVIASSFATVL